MNERPGRRGIHATSKQIVQFCTERDLPELFRCFADWYPFNPRLRERDYFDWQFKHAPTRLAEAEYDFLVLREDDRMVGCLGFTGFEFARNGRNDVGGWTHNWYAANQREGGLTLLGRFMELADNRFIIRFNENTAKVLSMLRVPMTAAIPRWWAAIDPAAAAALFEFHPHDSAILARSAQALPGIDDSAGVHPVHRFDPSEEFFLSHLGDDIGHARRTGRYLNWRYFAIPRHRYHAIRCDDEYAVFRVEPVSGTDVSVIRILEWTFGAKSSSRALSWIRRETADQRPILVDFHCSCRRVARTLEPLGFVEQSATTKPMPDLFRPTNHSGGYAIAIDLPPHRQARTIDFDNWYITIGDSDVDRVKL